MTSHLKVVLGGGVAVAVVLFLRADGGGDPVEPSVAGPAGPARPDDVADLPLEGELGGRADATAPAADPVSTPAPADDAPPHRLAVVVRDLDGLPSPGVEVLGAPPRHPLCVLGETDDAGRLEVSFECARQTAELVVQARAGGVELTGLRRLPTRGGATALVELAVTEELDDAARGPVPYVSVQELGLDEDESFPLLFEIHDTSSWNTEGAASAARRRPGLRTPRADPDGDGRVDFRTVDPRPDGTRTIRLASTARVRRPDLAALGNADEVLAAVRVRLGEPGALFGLVVDERGAPLEGARIEAWHAELGITSTARTDADGRYELVAAPGTLEVLVGDGEATGGPATLEMPAGQRVRRDGVAVRGHELSGTLVDPDGAPIAGARVVVETEGVRGPWIAVDVTDDAGAFRVRGVPTSHPRVILVPPGGRPGLPARVFDAVPTDVGPWSPDVDRPFLVPVRARVRPLDAEGPAAAELRVLSADGQLGARFALHGERGAAEAVDLPHGTWRAALLSLAGDRVDLGPFPPVLGAEVDLGAATFTERAVLALPASERGGGEAQGAVALVRVRDDGIESRAFEGPPPDELTLPAGRWRVVRGGVPGPALDLAPGERVEIPARPATPTAD